VDDGPLGGHWIEGRLAEWKDPLPIPVGTILPEGSKRTRASSIRSAPMARTRSDGARSPLSGARSLIRAAVSRA